VADVLAVAVALPSVASETLAPAEWSALADAEPSPPLMERPALAESHSSPCELAETLAEPVQSQPEPDAEDQPHLLPLPLSALALGSSSGTDWMVGFLLGSTAMLEATTAVRSW